MRNKKEKAFYDFEFTGLHQHTTPISLGIVTDSDLQFYAEFTDYDQDQVDEWVEENVIKKLMLDDLEPYKISKLGNLTYVKADAYVIALALHEWITDNFLQLEFWGDCSWYDAVLLNELFKKHKGTPEPVCIWYQDIAGLFRARGIDVDISREGFIDKPLVGHKHTALYDAQVIRECYAKLMRFPEKLNK